MTLIAPDDQHALTADQHRSLAGIGVKLACGPVGAFRMDGPDLILIKAGETVSFDAVYPALGSDIRSDLARSLGADLTDEGCIRVDAHQRTSIPGLYAAGDVVIGLDQISHAVGEAGAAATAIRNDLAARRPITRG